MGNPIGESPKPKQPNETERISSARTHPPHQSTHRQSGVSDGQYPTPVTSRLAIGQNIGGFVLTMRKGGGAAREQGVAYLKREPAKNTLSETRTSLATHHPSSTTHLTSVVRDNNTYGRCATCTGNPSPQKINSTTGTAKNRLTTLRRTLTRDPTQHLQQGYKGTTLRV